MFVESKHNYLFYPARIRDSKRSFFHHTSFEQAHGQFGQFGLFNLPWLPVFGLWGKTPE